MTAPMNTPQTYREAVQYTLNTRWAGQKDGQRSAQRATMAGVVYDAPIGDAFTRPRAHGVREYLRSVGLSPGSVNRHLAAYLAVWGTCHQAGWVAEPPPTGLYLREPRGRERVVTPEELERLLDELPAPYRGLAAFLYEVGCRVSEALKLEPRDIDLRARRVTFRDTKTADDRTVPLTPRAHLELERAPADLFAGLSQSAFNHAFSAARARMGLADDPQFCPHALRHGAVTRWVVAGVPLPIVSQLAGHRSIKTTARYAHPTIDHAEQALKKVGIL